MSKNDQYNLDFTSRRNDLLVLVASLRNVQIFLPSRKSSDGKKKLESATPGRVNGVVEFLQRLILLANDLKALSENGVKVQMMAIAGRIQGRSTATERTVRNWRRDAEALGTIQVDPLSQKFGGWNWNSFRIDFDRIRELSFGAETGGNGRKPFPPLRVETISGPGVETVSAPKSAKPTAPNKQLQLEEVQEEKFLDGGGGSSSQVMTHSEVEAKRKSFTEELNKDALASEMARGVAKYTQPSENRHWSFLNAVCRAVIDGEISEFDFNECVDALKTYRPPPGKPHNPGGFFRGCLQRRGWSNLNQKVQ